MADILIYTNPETLEHKQAKGLRFHGRYYWEFSRLPKNIEVGDRVYFATKGFVRGSFEGGDSKKLAICPSKCSSQELASDCSGTSNLPL